MLLMQVKWDSKIEDMHMKGPIIEKVKRIKGEFCHDWFWTRNGRQSKIANGYEIWFNVQEYLE